MTILLIMILLLGLSLDVYAVVVCFGAVLLKIEKTKLMTTVLIFALWQSVALFLGYLVTKIPIVVQATKYVAHFWAVLSFLIFCFLGVYMLYKAWKNKPFEERRDEVRTGKIMFTALLTSIDAFFAGLGFSFMGFDIWFVFISLLIITVIIVILGLFTGYILGFEQKKKAYIAGGVLLLAGAVDLLMNYIVILF